MEKRYITVQELSEYISISVGSLYQMVSRREIPFTKIKRRTRFDLKKINLWLRQNETNELKENIY